MTDCQRELGYLWSAMKNYSVGVAEEYLSIRRSSANTKNVNVNSLVQGKCSQQEIEDFSVLILILKYHHYQSITKLLLNVNVNKPNV